MTGNDGWTELGCATLRAGRATVEILGQAEVAAAWERPSVLPGLTVGGLAGHLGQMLGATAVWLAAEPVSLGLALVSEIYGLARLGDQGTDGEVATRIREWSTQAATAGAAGVAVQARADLDRLAELLPTTDRSLLVPSVNAPGKGMTVTDYLRSRCVELLVHADDLARSVSLPAPTPDPVAAEKAIAVLVELCRARAGDLAVLRALTRPDVADPDVLRAL